jgi:chitodextrinase
MEKSGYKYIFKKKLFYLILAIFFLPVTVLAANYFTLSPNSQTVAPGEAFSAVLSVDSTTDLFGVGFDLLFDPGLIEFTGASTTGSMLLGGATVNPSLLTAVNPAGDLIVSFSRFNPDIGVSTTSTSTIVTLNFLSLTGIGTTSSSTALTFPNGFTTLCFVAVSGSSCSYQNGTWQNGSVTVQDFTPPTTPGSFIASATSVSTIDLSWASSTDANGAPLYYIYRNSTSTLIATTSSASYGDSGLSASTTYNYFVKAVDSAGNPSGFATTSGTTLSDTTSPSVTILTPTTGATYNSSSTPITLTGTSTDNLAVTSITWSRVNGSTATGTAVGTSTWTASGISLLTGSNVISIVVRDGAGNTATGTLTVTFDNTAPAVTITAPTAAATASASSTSFTLGGTASDANGVSSVIWSNSLGGSGTTTGTSSWSVSGALLNLQIGSNLVTVTASDSFGNTATDTLTITFDNQAPVITISSPTSTVTYYASSSLVNLSGTSTDNVAVTAISLSGGSGTTTGTSSWSITGITLAGATTTLTVAARDSLNNTATDTITVYLDTSVPVIPTSTPASASAASASQINLTWPAATDTGNSGLAGYKIYRSSTSSAPVATIASTSTSWSDTGLSASTGYTYYIFAYDNAGNQSESFATSSATTSAAPVTPPSGGGGGGGGGTITPADTIAPARPTNFKAAPTDSQLMLSWTNPTDSDFGGVLILRTESLSTPVCPSAYNDTKAKEVYRGKAIERAEIGLNNNMKYCYAIYSFDNIPNYSSATTLTVQPGVGQIIAAATSTITTTGSGDQTTSSTGNTGLADAPGAVVDTISLAEAHQIFDRNEFVALDSVTQEIYKKIMAQVSGTYNDQQKKALAYFIHIGTPNTRVLGAGERGGSVGSFVAAFGRLSRTVEDWQDVVKIGNGRWPKQTNLKAEAAAEIVFKKIYLHAPKRATNKYEDNAIRVIAYGLRPSKRNMASEAAAIKSFRYIFKRAPAKANDWDIVRAIAYSGAKR